MTMEKFGLQPVSNQRAQALVSRTLRRSQRSPRLPTESQTSLIEELDPADFERCAHRLKIAGLHARNTVVSFRARNGGLGYAAPLRQLAHGPVEETSCGTDLGTRDVWFRGQLSRPPKKATRSREWPSLGRVTPSEECPSPARLVPALVRKRRCPQRPASAQLPKNPSICARCRRIGRVEGKGVLDADRTGARKSLTAKPEECPTLPGCAGDCAAQV